MKIYISGPITGHPDYMKNFQETEDRLKSRFRNAGIINPAKLSEILPEKEMEYGDYIKVCLALIDISDVVCMMSGWERSRGARLEEVYAETQGKTIIYEVN